MPVCVPNCNRRIFNANKIQLPRHIFDLSTLICVRFGYSRHDGIGAVDLHKLGIATDSFGRIDTLGQYSFGCQYPRCKVGSFRHCERCSAEARIGERWPRSSFSSRSNGNGSVGRQSNFGFCQRCRSCNDARCSNNQCRR